MNQSPAAVRKPAVRKPAAVHRGAAEISASVLARVVHRGAVVGRSREGVVAHPGLAAVRPAVVQCPGPAAVA